MEGFTGDEPTPTASDRPVVERKATRIHVCALKGARLSWALGCCHTVCLVAIRASRVNSVRHHTCTCVTSGFSNHLSHEQRGLGLGGSAFGGWGPMARGPLPPILCLLGCLCVQRQSLPPHPTHIITVLMHSTADGHAGKKKLAVFTVSNSLGLREPESHQYGDTPVGCAEYSRCLVTGSRT